MNQVRDPCEAEVYYRENESCYVTKSTLLELYCHQQVQIVAEFELADWVAKLILKQLEYDVLTEPYKCLVNNQRSRYKLRADWVSTQARKRAGDGSWLP